MALKVVDCWRVKSAWTEGHAAFGNSEMPQVPMSAARATTTAAGTGMVTPSHNP